MERVAFLGNDARVRYYLASVLGQHIYQTDSALALYTEPAKITLSKTPNSPIPLVTISPDSLLHYPNNEQTISQELQDLTQFSLLFLLSPLRLYKSPKETLSGPDVVKLITSPSFSKTRIYDIGNDSVAKAQKVVCDMYSLLVIGG